MNSTVRNKSAKVNFNFAVKIAIVWFLISVRSEKILIKGKFLEMRDLLQTYFYLIPMILPFETAKPN